jgi:hypothetical protein
MDNYASMLLEFETGKQIIAASHTFYLYNLVSVFVVLIFVFLCNECGRLCDLVVRVPTR